MSNALINLKMKICQVIAHVLLKSNNIGLNLHQLLRGKDCAGN